ncbi:MAG: hypothetical protein KDK65_02215 [Chlamydiia bacterium]|nr:hypothetical protein [Chlamydiia bacterium]
MDQKQHFLHLVAKISESDDEESLSNAAWNLFEGKERQQLAKLMQARGARQLEQGNAKSVETFRRAAWLADDDPHLLLEQARLWAKHVDNRVCLLQALSLYRKIIELYPEKIGTWFELAQVMMEMGSTEGKVSHFEQAIVTFEKGITLFKKEKMPLPSSIHWPLGRCWLMLARESEEALELRKACECFQVAEEGGFEDPHFYYDYAQVYAHMGLILGQVEHFLVAIELLQKCMGCDPDFTDAQVEIAFIYTYLYQYQRSSEWFVEADQAFREAAKRKGKHVVLWLKWGDLLAIEGRHSRDKGLLLEAIQKLEKAHEIEEDHPTVLMRWADTLCTLGSWEDDLSYLHQARDMMERVIQIAPENVAHWWVSGNCMVELGHYFEDSKYFFDAIKHYEFGLSLEPEHVHLWSSMGVASFAIGELNRDEKYIEKGIACFTKAVQFGGDEHSQIWNDWGVCLLELADCQNDASYLTDALAKFDQAIKVLQKGIEELVSDDPELLFNYGCTLEYLGDAHDEPTFYEKAIAVFNPLIEAYPNYTQARHHLALSCFQLGTICYDEELFALAIGHFETLYQQDPEDAMSWNDCGIASIYLAQLINDPCLHDQVHELYREAEVCLYQASRLGHAEADYNLACLYSLTGQFEPAMSALSQAHNKKHLPPADDLLRDHWIQPLKNHPPFRTFIYDVFGRHL